MENNQTAQMVAWLDEERRKDKSLIAKLEERNNAQAALIKDQSQRIQNLESDLGGLKKTILTTSFFDETLDRVRIELNTRLDQLEERRQSSLQETKKLRDLDREALTKALEEIRQEINIRIERELTPRKAEEERLARVAGELQTYADNLSKGFEEFERTLNFLEEQRRQDSRRLSDTTGQVLDLGRRAEDQQTKLELIEELSRRNERGLEDMNTSMLEMRQQRQDWMAEEGLASQRREQTITDVVRRMESFEEQMTDWSRQVVTWGETHRAMKKELDDFNRLAERIDRRLNEVGEVQRLSEDRFRQEWEQFLQDDQKRQRQFTLTNEETWRENNKSLEDMRSRLASLTEISTQLSAHLQTVRSIQEEYLRGISGSAQTLYERSQDEIKSTTTRVKKEK
jgi:chromosome segregation ATPase